MLRKLLAVLAVLTAALTGLVMSSASALARPLYPAPPAVTVAGAPAPGAAVSGATTDTATTLASTGSGFNVGATVLIAAVVLVLGVALVVLGRRLRRPQNR